MPRINHGLSCPRCGSGPFSKEASLLKHMNHPYSRCASLIHLAQAPEEAGPNIPSRQTLPSHNDLDDMLDYDPEQMSDPALNLDSDAMEEEPTSASRFEHFSEASQTFGRAESFMDQFDADRYANERKNNLYFPWASKGDYGLGAWLLRSGLSIRAIDEFLALELVCHPLYSVFLIFSFPHRYIHFPYHSSPQRTFARVQRNSRQGHSGSVNHGQSNIPQSAPSTFSTGIV